MSWFHTNQKRGYRCTIAIFLITVCLVSIVGVGCIVQKRLSSNSANKFDIAGTQLFSRTQLIAKGLIAPPRQILAVTLTYQRTSGIYTVVKMQKRMGYIPRFSDEEKLQQILVLYNKQNQVLGKTRFMIPSMSPHKITVSMTENIAWNTAGDHLAIYNQRGALVTTAAIPEPVISSIPLSPTTHTLSMRIDTAHESNHSNVLAAQSPAGVVNLVIMADGYSQANMSQFHTDAATAIKTLLSFEPMHSRASQFQFHVVDNMTDLHCNDTPLSNGSGDLQRQVIMVCDPSLVTQAVNQAGVPSDSGPGIIVFSNDPSSEDAAGAPEYFVSKNVYMAPPPGMENIYNFSLILAHEFGHSFGRLLDEYALGQDGPIDNQLHSAFSTGQGNCYGGTPPASQWANFLIPTTAYNKFCLYDNWYSSRIGSLMDQIGPNFFSVAAQQMLNDRIDQIAGKSTDTTPPTCSINPPTNPIFMQTIQNGGSIEIQANDDVGVTRVVLLSDGVPVDDSYTQEQDLVTGNTPHYYVLLPKTISPGTHILTGKAFDAAGNVGTCTLNVTVTTDTPTPIPTRPPRLTITPSISVRPTNAQGTTFTLSVCPHGLGTCGDNTNSSGGNIAPLHTQRSVVVSLLDQTNKPIATSSGTVSYASASAHFEGTVSFPLLTSGTYLASIKMEGFLKKQFTGIVSVISGQVNTLPAVSLTTGDINNDNQLDILDYNLLISCFGSKQMTPTCQYPSTSQSSGADLNDDGSVSGDDYNLFLRELSVQKGAS